MYGTLYLELVMILITFPEYVYGILDMSVEVKKGGHIQLSQIMS